MWNFIIDKFYLFFEGILIFQFLLFLYLYKVSQKKELFYYSLFVLLTSINFFISDPFLFGLGDDEKVLNSTWYKLFNTPLVIVANIFYVRFLNAFYNTPVQNNSLFKILQVVKIFLLVALVIFFILFLVDIPTDLLFNTLNAIGILMGIWVIVVIKRERIPFAKFMMYGLISNLVGTLFTVFLLTLLAIGIKNIFTYDYPFIFLKIGILIEIFFFNIAILKKWLSIEKEMAVQHLETQLLVEKLRNQISQELHDDIGSTLSGIVMYSHLAKEQIKNTQPTAIDNSLSIIQNNADEMVNKLNDFIWLINPEQDSLLQLLQRLEDYAVQMAAAKNIRVKSNIDGYFAKNILSTETRRNIYLLFKEAINNAVKYSEATIIEFRVALLNNKLNITITDNGKGFDKTVIKGNGLINMKKRSQQMDATLSLESAKGQGTTLSLKMNIIH